MTQFTPSRLLSPIEAALAALWRSWGIEPDFVLGHSLGEYAAAYVAGMLPLGDAIRLVAERGRLTHQIANSGAMAAVLAPYEIVATEIDEVAEHSRSPLTTDRNITSSVGRGRQLKQHLHAWKRWVLRRSFSASHMLRIPLYRSGSAFVRKGARDDQFKPARVALVSNVTGLSRNGEMADPNTG